MIKTGSMVVLVSFLFGIYAQAATVVQSTVDRNEMALGDTFTLTVSVISDEDGDVAEPRMPNMSEFDFLNNWASSAVSQKLVQTDKGMQFETQRRKEFHYMMSPKQTGTLSVSSVEVVVKGKVYRTQPILLKVDKEGQHGQNQGRSGRRGRGQPGNQGPGGAFPRMPPGFEDPFDGADSAEEDMFNQLLQQQQRLLQQLQQGGGGMPEPFGGSPAAGGLKNPVYRSLPTNINEAFFISLELDKTEVYEGEQITANWYVYTRGQMETFDRLKFPDLRGFWKEVIEEVPAIQFSQEVVNGVPWKKALLASHALFPMKAGKVAIDEYKVKSRVRLPTQGFGYSGQIYEYTKSSGRVEIKVKPLPAEGKPFNFTGAVGRFDLIDNVEKTTVPVNEPFTLKVRFEGTGNAKLIDLPAMNMPSQLEQYDSKSDSKFFKNGRSYKEFEVLMIPRQEGEFQIPELSVSMFDPATSKYYTKKTPPINLKIVANPNAPVGSSQRMAGAGKPSPATSVSENKLPDLIMTWQPALQGSVTTRPWLWIVIFTGILAGLGVKAQREFGWGHRRRTLKDLIQKRYNVVNQALAQSDFRKVGLEMTHIFYIILGQLSGETTGEGGASQKIENLLEMIPPSVRREHGTEISKKFEIFQTLSFAPEEMLGGLKEFSQMSAQVEQTKKLINDLVQVLKEKG